MTDDYAEHLRQHDEILRSLAPMLASQHTINERQDAINARLTAAIEALKEINTGVQTTLARVETLLARMLRTDTNGQDAEARRPQRRNPYGNPC